MERQIISWLSAFIFTLSLSAQVKNNISLGSNHLEMHRIIGCWNDSESQLWTYGFFEKFAIYDNDFWEYQTIDFKKDKADITLRKGSEVRKLKLSFSSEADSICTLACGKGKKMKLLRHSYSPGFTASDTAPFLDNGYRTDSVTITGYLRHASRSMPLEILVDPFFTSRDEAYYADIDSLGRFRITIPILNTTEVLIDWQKGGCMTSTVLEPGEDLFFYHDYATSETRYMGNNARIHQEIENYRVYPPNKAWNKFIYADEKIEHDLFLQKQQNLYGEQRDIYNQYIATHPKVSDRFKLFTDQGLLVEYGSNLMQRRFMLERRTNESFSKPYMDDVRKLYLQIPQPYTLFRNTSTFLRDYWDYYNGKRNSNYTSGDMQILKHLGEEGIYPLTAQQIEDLDAYERAIGIALMGQYSGLDSLEIQRRVEPYRKGLLRTDTLLCDSTVIRIIEKHKHLSDDLMEIKSIKNEITCFDSIPVTELQRDLQLTKAAYGQLNQKKKPLAERSIEYLMRTVANEALKKRILDRQAYHIQLDKQDIDYAASLKKTDHLKESKDADRLLSQLIEPYKGKVIYVDIWGTWCGPCKAEMQHAPAIVEAMKNQEVIFMYLANNSPEDSWKNVIKENHLTGPNVVHYNFPREQQELLERRLSVRAFPTYLFIDKKGNIVDMKPPRPSDKEELIKRLNELLKE